MNRHSIESAHPPSFTHFFQMFQFIRQFVICTPPPLKGDVSPFWSQQPVMRTLPITYTGAIQAPLTPQFPPWLQSQMSCIKMDIITNISPLRMASVVQLLRQHYHQNPTTGNSYNPTLNDVIPYANHPHSCLSISHTDESPQTLNGVMLSRPLLAQFAYSTKCHTLTYYDFLCVAINARNRTIAPALIQSHINYISATFPQVQGGLFKQEGDLTEIIPLTQYDTPCFKVESFSVINTEAVSEAPQIRCESNITASSLSNALAFMTHSQFVVRITPYGNDLCGHYEHTAASAYIAIEGLSDNVRILHHLTRKGFNPVTITPMAYYLHNFSCANASIAPQKVLIIS